MSIKKILSAFTALALVITSTATIGVNAASIDNTAVSDTVNFEVTSQTEADSEKIVSDNENITENENAENISDTDLSAEPVFPKDESLVFSAIEGKVIYPAADGYERAYPIQAETDGAEYVPSLFSARSSVTFQTLEEVYVDVTLTDYICTETGDNIKGLDKVKLSDIFDNMTYRDSGEKVEIPEGSKFVCVGNSQYDILDTNATLKLFYDSKAADMIIGTAKQLSVTDKVYHINFNISCIEVDVPYIADAIKLYYLDENGDRHYIELEETKSEDRYDCHVSFKEYFPDGTPIYMDLDNFDTSKVQFIRYDNGEASWVSCGDVTFSIARPEEDTDLMNFNSPYNYWGQIRVDFTDPYGNERMHSKTIYAYETLIGISGNYTTNPCYSVDGYGYMNAIDTSYTFLGAEFVDLDELKSVKMKFGLNVFNRRSTIYHTGLKAVDTGCIIKAVIGKYNSLKEIEEANAVDIKDELFSSETGFEIIDYLEKYDNDDDQPEYALDFTIILDGTNADVKPYVAENASEHLINVTFCLYKYMGEIEGPTVDFSRYMRINGIYGDYNRNNNSYTDAINSTGFCYDDDQGSLALDSYTTQNHCYTAFIYDEDGTIDMSKIYLDVDLKNNANVYNALHPERPVDFTLPQDFSNGENIYTIAVNGEQETCRIIILKNETDKARLFVNSPEERRIFIENSDDYHDIMIANLGDQPLTNLKAELIDPVNIEFDGYWQLDGSAGASTLNPFGTTDSGSGNKEILIDNMAKIRLKPTTYIDIYGSKVVQSGPISGTLRITSDQETVDMKLTGYSGAGEIITDSELKGAVKYVPFQSIIAVDDIAKWYKPTFSVVSGSLPEGVTLDENTGELYGVPGEVGTFEFEISVKMSKRYEDLADISDITKKKTFTLTVENNSNTNVYDSTDPDYDVKAAIGQEATAGERDYYLTPAQASQDQRFVSNGTYANFAHKLWFNGELLTEGADYTAEEGSTVITVKSQTLSKLPANQMNTIAAEFRISGGEGKVDKVLRAAQNFVIRETGSSGGSSTPGTSTSDPSASTSDPSASTSDPSASTSDPSASTSTPSASGGSSDAGTVGEISSPDNSSGTSAPTENDVVFKPVHVDGELADIINGITVTAPRGVMSENAVLTVKPDGSIPADKGTALDFTFMLNGEKIQPSGFVTVRMPISDALKSLSALYVYHITNGKYEFVESWRDGDFIRFKADSFSTYIVSGKKLGSSGNAISNETPGDSDNPLTGAGVSAAGIVLSAAVLFTVLTIRKKKR